MPRRRDKNGGLDLSGVGKKNRSLPGGDPKSLASSLSFTSEATDSARAPKQKRQKKKGTFVRSTGLDGSQQTATGPAPRTRMLIALLVVGSLALAIAVGALVYQMTVRNALKIDLDETELAAALTEPKESAAGYWSVIAITDATSAELGHGTLTDVALVRVNLRAESISFLWLPDDLRVYLPGYGYRTLAQVLELEGATGVITVAGNLADASVAHYFEVNAAGLTRLAGELSTDLTADSSPSTLADAACAKIAESTTESIESLATEIDLCVSSDLDASSLADVLIALQDIEAESVYHGDAPTTTEDVTGETHVVIDSELWGNMVARVTGGLSPTADEAELESNTSLRDSMTVTVWNGVGVSGVAADCTDELTSLGWNVEVTGNAAQYVYDETFIIYKYDEDKKAANLMQDDLGQGRIVRSAARYNFDTTLLVVVGSDYQPY